MGDADQARGQRRPGLQYLAAYVSRGPIHPSRIRSWDGSTVSFRYRDSAGVEQTSFVTGQEFVRRLLQHVPPKGFQRVRHYGWLAAAAKAKRERIQALLDWRPPSPEPAAKKTSPLLCPCCGKPMRLIGTLPRSPP